MTAHRLDTTERWRQEFALDPRVVERVQAWVLEDLRDAPLPADDLRAIAAAVCETARTVRTSWSHAQTVQVDVVIEHGAVEIRLSPKGEQTLDDCAEWLLYRPE